MIAGIKIRTLIHSDEARMVAFARTESGIDYAEKRTRGVCMPEERAALELRLITLRNDLHVLLRLHNF